MQAHKQLPVREIAAICPPGLEQVVARELTQLGWPTPRTTPGVVTCMGSSLELFRACMGCRTATDLRVRVGRTTAVSLEGLAQGLGKLQWSLFVHPGQAVRITVSSRGSRLKRKDAVARKAELAIRDAVRGPRVNYHTGGHRQRTQAPVHIHLRIEESHVEASVDPVGDSLWKRGYRSRGGAAPLRENLAAASLLAMGWQKNLPLVDPFCGSGTLLIEAAGMATGRLPGAGRSFALEHWPCHVPKLWRKLQGEAKAHARLTPAALMGADADQAVLDVARENAAQAGVARAIGWAHQRIDVLEPPAPGPGLVLTNPPWGQRLGSNVTGVYGALGRALRGRFGGWDLGLLCPDRGLVQALNIPMQPRLEFPHGGARLTLWAGRVPEAHPPRP